MRASMQDSTRDSMAASEMDVFAKARSSNEHAKEPVPFLRLARRMSLVTVVYFCYGWTLWFFLAWVPQFFLHNYRMNLNHSAFFSGGVFLGGVLGDFSGGVVSDRIFEKTGDRKKARRNLIIFGFLCSLVMMLPIVLVHNLTSAAIFLSLAFFFAEFTVAPIWAIPMDIAPNFSGFASGFMNSGSALAAIISPVLAGKIIDATGNWELPFYGSIGSAFIGRHPRGLDEDRGDAQRACGERRARGATGGLMAKLIILIIPNLRDPLKTLPPLPLSSHAKPVDSFAAAAELEKELQKTVEGEVRFDRGSRALYAADASNYRQVPIGLVIPRDEGDVIATVAACRKFGAPVLPRGAGTSLAGQCCNVAVVLDFTKYMNRILEIDAEARFARVQPGVVLDRLRERAELHHLTFGPDPSTHSRCTLGGMIGNNSCGTHSLARGQDRGQCGASSASCCTTERS